MAVPIIETCLYFKIPAVSLSAKCEPLPPFFFFAAFTLGKPKAMSPAGIKIKEKTIAISTPKEVNKPKYLIG